MKNRLIIIAAFVGIVLLMLTLRNCKDAKKATLPVIEKKVVKIKIDSINGKQEKIITRKDSANAAIDSMPKLDKRKRARQIYLRRRKEREGLEDHECDEHGG